jgi:hypothetical protein
MVHHQTWETKWGSGCGALTHLDDKPNHQLHLYRALRGVRAWVGSVVLRAQEDRFQSGGRFPDVQRAVPPHTPFGEKGEGGEKGRQRFQLAAPHHFRQEDNLGKEPVGTVSLSTESEFLQSARGSTSEHLQPIR